MASLEEIRQSRLQKLAVLRAAGIDPYPARVPRDASHAEIIASFDDFAKRPSIAIAGRVMAIRGQGGLAFIDVSDGTAKLQILLKEGDIATEKKDLFLATVDIGDFISCTGTLFVSKRGEKTLLASDWLMATKSLRPLPEKWHGITDPEDRYRQRYLDLAMRPELRELFQQKAAFWRTTRRFLEDRGFLEVETPYLEVTTGGAEARPFATHHNDFDIDLYLRISVGELWQKRLMAGGFPKTFEIGRVFRNEGTSPEHLQEFTNVEFYSAYTDYEEGMKLVQEMYLHIAREVFGTTVFEVNGHTFDLSHDWKRIDYSTEILERTGVAIHTATEAQMKDALKKLSVDYTGSTKERLIDSLWKYCRKQIAGPAFLVGHPMVVAPLAKLDQKNKDAVQMFQPIFAGSEVGRGYSELNDPIDQAQRFEVQKKLIESGDEEAMMPDYEFVEMLEHGMPPTFGYGFGERMFSLLSAKPIRETQLFPLLKPKGKEKGKE